MARSVKYRLPRARTATCLYAKFSSVGGFAFAQVMIDHYLTAMTNSSDSQIDRAPDKRYARPPITEAVIELRFEPSVRLNILKKANSHFAKHYPGVQELRNFSVRLEFGEATESIVDQGDLFFRRASSDETQLIIISEQSLLISQLAPYTGWREFSNRLKRDITIWKNTVGVRRLTRIGMRYINRIDIPANDQKKIDYEKYLNVYPHMSFESISAYSLNIRRPIKDIQCELTINTATVQPPLYGFGSHLLDLDFGRVENVPQGVDQIMEFLSVLRQKKNEIFEDCITDRARALFECEPYDAR